MAFLLGCSAFLLGVFGVRIAFDIHFISAFANSLRLDQIVDVGQSLSRLTWKRGEGGGGGGGRGRGGRERGGGEKEQ